MSNFSLCKFKDEKLMTLCSNIPRMSPICQIPIWRIRVFCATHTTQSNWVPVFLLLLFCKKKKKGYPIWWESWSRGLINWAQTFLTRLACFLSFASLFSFQKSREDRTYSRNASVDKLNGVAMQVCRINQINIKGISGCSARFPNYLNLIAKVQKCPFSLQFFSLRSRFCQIPMTRIKRKRRLIKSKLVNPINVRRWRSSKFLCIRARSLVWPSLKGHRGRIAGILWNKGSLL